MTGRELGIAYCTHLLDKKSPDTFPYMKEYQYFAENAEQPAYRMEFDNFSYYVNLFDWCKNLNIILRFKFLVNNQNIERIKKQYEILDLINELKDCNIDASKKNIHKFIKKAPKTDKNIIQMIKDDTYFLNALPCLLDVVEQRTKVFNVHNIFDINYSKTKTLKELKKLNISIDDFDFLKIQELCDEIDNMLAFKDIDEKLLKAIRLNI